MKKQTILITAGPTIEPIDPVRFISNHSSGKMGYALARACIKKGHRVILISGPTALEPPHPCKFYRVKTALEMLKAVSTHAKKANLIMMTAAVADYRVKKVAGHKIKKSKKILELKLVKNPDILQTLGRLKKKGQTLVGFAAETQDGIKNAQKKLKEKNLDWIVLNVISNKNPVFGSNTNQVTLISQSGKIVTIPEQSKLSIAKKIIKTIDPARLRHREVLCQKKSYHSS